MPDKKPSRAAGVDVSPAGETAPGKPAKAGGSRQAMSRFVIAIPRATIGGRMFRKGDKIDMKEGAAQFLLRAGTITRDTPPADPAPVAA